MPTCRTICKHFASARDPARACPADSRCGLGFWTRVADSRCGLALRTRVADSENGLGFWTRFLDSVFGLGFRTRRTDSVFGLMCIVKTRWRLSSSSDLKALAVVDGKGPLEGLGPHYSRRTPGSKTFTGVGREIVLVTVCGRAVWAVVYQRTPCAVGSGASRGRSGTTDEKSRHIWRNMVFRNEGCGLSEAVGEGGVGTQSPTRPNGRTRKPDSSASPSGRLGWVTGAAT